jgi:uncharacterized repeat protein (TIGR01451 family)
MKPVIFILGLLFASTAALASEVKLASEIFVERVRLDAQGRSNTVLEEPNMVTPGDKLLFVLAYKNEGSGPAADFVINNPVPESVTFAGSESTNALMSVDGGKSWGRLAALKVTQPDGTVRAAVAGDVTNVRWQFARPIPAGGEGTVKFRAVVK